MSFGKREKLSIYLSVSALILLLCSILLYKYVFLGYEILGRGIASDLLRINLPTYYMIYDNIGKGMWSWNMGIGTSMMSHGDAMFDPFTYVCFIFGRDGIPHMMAWCLIVKLIAAGLCFALYLRRLSLGNTAVIFGSVLYAFSGYHMIMGLNLALGTVCVYFPLILLGLEQFICENKKLLLIISLSLTAIYFYYYFYMCGIISCIYLIVRLAIRRPGVKRSALKVGGLALAGICSAAIAMFVLLPQLSIVLSNARVTGGTDTQLSQELFKIDYVTLCTAVLRSFGNDMLGSPFDFGYMGYSNDYFQLSSSLSVAVIIFLFQAFALNKKSRPAIAVSVVLITVATAIPFFSYIMNGFSTINFRWYFAVSAMQALALAAGIDAVIKARRFSFPAMAASMLSTALLIYCSINTLSKTMAEKYLTDKEDNYRALCESAKSSADTIIFVFTGVCVIWAMLSLPDFLRKHLPSHTDAVHSENAGMRRISDSVTRCSAVFLAFIIMTVELRSNYLVWFTNDGLAVDYGNSGEPYSSYEDASLELIQSIQSSDNGFYRINKDFDSILTIEKITSENDAMAQRYFGLKCYNSSNNRSYVNFLQKMGIYVALYYNVEHYIQNGVTPENITGPDLNFIHGVYDRYMLMSYLGVKYFISEGPRSDLPDYFSYLRDENGLFVYQNSAAMPLAFANRTLVSYDDFMEADDETKDLILMNATVVTAETAEKYGLSLSPIADYTVSDSASNAASLRSSFELISFSNDRVVFDVDITSGARILSFSVPYDSGWKVYVDGQKTDTVNVNISLLGAIVPEGEHTIELRYSPSSYSIGIAVSAVSALAGATALILTNIGPITAALRSARKKLRGFAERSMKKARGNPADDITPRRG